MAGCPLAASEWAELYCLGRLTPEQKAQFEEHCMVCQSCLDKVESTYAIIEELRGNLYPKRGPGNGSPPKAA